MLLARNSLIQLAIGLLLLGSFLLLSEAQRKDAARRFGLSGQQGKREFTSLCSGCHGLDARGGERAPNIADSVKVRRHSDEEIAQIISNGIPGTGMPAFHSLNTQQVKFIVGYLRVLEGRGKSSALLGNPASGKEVFFGKGGCSSCHMVEGQGGFIGPDLSEYGLTRSAKDILDAIIDPKKSVSPFQRPVMAVTHDGHQFRGLIRNEDNFSVQLETEEGAFIFLLRSELNSIEPQKDPLMPTDYAQKLSRKELDDLASYLMAVGRSSKTSSNSGDED